MPNDAKCGLVLGLALVIWVWARPAVAAYLIIFLDPLTAGIDRGSAVPILRPNEAIALVMGLTLAARGLVRLRTGELPRLRLDRLEWALVLMAVTSSFVPLLWMAVRHQPISKDDVEYALVLWKFLGLYTIIRAAVTCVATSASLGPPPKYFVTSTFAWFKSMSPWIATTRRAVSTFCVYHWRTWSVVND